MQRSRVPGKRHERIAGRILSSLVVLVATYFFLLLYDMVSPVMFTSIEASGEHANRAATRQSAAGTLIMIILVGSWAYAVWVSFRYVWSHRVGTVYSRSAMALGVVFGLGSVVQAVFTLLVALGVESGDLVSALITVPVFMGAAIVAILVGRYLLLRFQQIDESRNV